MAHFAQLDENNIVQQVIVVHNNECIDENGIEHEDLGVNFCKSLFGENTIWKQTSYNANIRKHYAGIGYTYNEELDAFISPQPYPSWTLDTTSCTWVSPIKIPDDGNYYTWNEELQQWELYERYNDINI